MTLRTAVLAALLCGFAALARADALTADAARELVREGAAALDQAAALSREQPQQAAAHYRAAVQAFESLCEGGVRNAGVHFNLGNAYFRLGDLGRSILHYRAALRYAPRDPSMRANLDFVRNRVEPAIAPSGESRELRGLLFWQYATSLEMRFWLGAGGSLLGWTLLIVWLFWRVRTIATVGLVAAVFGAANIGLVVWQLQQERQHPLAVVVGREATLRLGRGEGYDPAMRQPLGPGVELRIEQERGGWYEVRLAARRFRRRPAIRLTPRSPFPFAVVQSSATGRLRAGSTPHGRFRCVGRAAGCTVSRVLPPAARRSRQDDRRASRHRRRRAAVPVRRRPRAARGCARPGQDAADPHAVGRAQPRVLAHSVHP
jgi:hypothetical protein